MINIELPLHASNSRIEVCNDDVHIDIKRQKNFDVYLRCSYGNGQRLSIGSDNYFHGVCLFLDADSCLRIGNENLFSHGVHIWANDGHSIIDRETRLLLNDNRIETQIGSHCWFGERCTVTKNAIIPDNTIIATSAVVTKKFNDMYTAIGGNPAQVIRKNCEWTHLNTYYYKQQLSGDNS